MKKNVLIMAVIVMALSFISTPTVLGQNFWLKSRIKSGDKNLPAVERSHQMMARQIAGYQEQITELKQDNEKILREIGYSRDSVVTARFRTELSENDRLITAYRQKVAVLENQADAFLLSTAAKGQEKSSELVSHDPRIVAQADVISAYADQIRGQNGPNLSGSSAVPTDSSAYRVLLINKWFKDVTVSIVGPSPIVKNTELLKDSRRVITLDRPLVPGTYTIVFTGPSGTLTGIPETRTTTKQVGPLNQYEDAKGKKYAFIATLFEN
jgi:hypothetical protein